jgi:glycosyltransferase involved in cell wall biosynthesis
MPAFDLIPVTMPQMNAGQSDLVHRYYAEMAHYADTITSISLATEHALRLFLADEELPVPHIATNPLPGFDIDMDTSDQAQAGQHSSRHRLRDKPFVLSVSTIEIRKNHLILAKIWAECAREGFELPLLVLVGRFGWDVDELLRWVTHAPELQDRVMILADVEDDELVEMYRDCMFTVFPSRIEGWGLPITESLTYGKVCIHSSDPAQAEASQGLMPAHHPDDFVAWKSEILRMVSDVGYRTQLESAIGSSYVRRTPEDYCVAYELILQARRSVAT